MTKIGAFNQRWLVHPRRRGDLILTSPDGVAVVNTTQKVALVGTSLKAMQGFSQDLVELRQDVVDRLLDAEDTTKASPLPAHRIHFSDMGVRVVACDPSSSPASA